MDSLKYAVLAWDERLRGLFARIGSFAPGLLLRLILAVEFMEAGLQKLHGDNWFGDIHSDFPFPFNVLPVGLSWFIATWAEIIGAALLVVGLGTRYAAAMLMVVTFVAAYAVHFPPPGAGLAEFWQGYAVSNQGFGNYKLPLLFFIMFLALLGNGPGKLSLDHWIARRNGLA
ncbi:MAG: DoxX family protein [Moraxellaceae bacterium]|nr:DoxX family protein [Moraxellaceae bacterium]